MQTKQAIRKQYLKNKQMILELWSKPCSIQTILQLQADNEMAYLNDIHRLRR